MNDEVERAIQKRGLTGARVSPERVEACIAYEYYTTGDMIAKNTTGVLGNRYATADFPYPEESLRLLTICILVLRNGFTVVGKSACASPENFDEYIGRQAAREDAKGQIWALEGYLLKDNLNAANRR